MKKKLMTLLAAMWLFCAPAQAVGETIELPVVMYHHISEDTGSLGPYVIAPWEFRADLRWLKENGFETVSVQELLAWEAGRFQMPEKPVLITFDDGYVSTAVYAAPILEEYSYTATVAVVGAVAQAYTESGESDVRYAHMDWPTIRAFSEGDTLEIQYHSWDMHHVDGQGRRGCVRRRGESAGEYRTELTEDWRRFQTICAERGVKLCGGAAYPFGLYDAESERLMQELGISCTFSCEERVNHLTGAAGELYNLGRYNRPHGVDSAAFFGCWNLG